MHLAPLGFLRKFPINILYLMAEVQLRSYSTITYLFCLLITMRL
jgi:hypothetical protein